eukprot:7062851-Prymnesium_polylepis.2
MHDTRRVGALHVCGRAVEGRVGVARHLARGSETSWLPLGRGARGEGFHLLQPPGDRSLGYSCRICAYILFVPRTAHRVSRPRGSRLCKKTAPQPGRLAASLGGAPHLL